MTTIYDIAKKTGLAPSTVSKVLNNYKGVSEKTKKKVEQAAEELKYIPNMSARSLMTKRSYLIGVLIKENQSIGMIHPHFNEILEHFRIQMSLYGFDIIFLNNKVGDKYFTYLEHCKYRSIDGLLIAVGFIYDTEGAEQIKELVTSDLPKVSIEELYPNTPTVLSDNVEGTKEALNYLYSLGHRNIGLVNVQGNSVASLQREQGYKIFLNENKLIYNPENIIYVPGYNYESGIIAAKNIINTNKLNLPTAYLCVYDEIAIGLIDTLKKHNFDVPNDLSIMGFDDITIAKHTGLTTIRQSRSQIGLAAANLLYKLIEKKECKVNQIKLPTKLIIRQSCQRLKLNEVYNEKQT